MLEFLHGARVKEMEFAVAAPLVLAVIRDLHALAHFRLEGTRVPAQHVASKMFERDATEARVKAWEVPGQDVI